MRCIDLRIDYKREEPEKDGKTKINVPHNDGTNDEQNDRG